LKPGAVYIAHGGADLTFSRRLNSIQLMSRPESPDYLWHPSVDLMVNSALERMAPEKLIGVLLTGMGYDGAESMARLHDMGGRTIAEAEESCAVFGMPAELIARHGATAVLPSDAVAGKLLEWVR
jgi:two-component system, chemotaxis family, protein-glutamate methylesterase/glutaminase